MSRFSGLISTLSKGCVGGLRECARLCIIRLKDRAAGRSPSFSTSNSRIGLRVVYWIAGMNFLLAQLEDNTLRCALRKLPNRIRGTPEAARTLREVVRGVQPNTSKMLSWYCPTQKRGITVTAQVEVFDP